jgi:preprotein translocase subunit SecA
MRTANISDRAESLRDRLFHGESEFSLAVEAFSLLQEAAHRQLGLKHRTNQLQVAWHLLCRQVVEFPTGEGKTLAVTPTLALRAFTGRGAWLATANDYLARRDATMMQPVFELLGLSTGYLQSQQTLDERRRAYACDITYGTIREFGFDFLRDRLNQRRNLMTGEQQQPLQRERFSIIVDEADSILLDDARTPLIISEPKVAPQPEMVFRWGALTGRSLVEDLDFFVDPISTSVWLTDQGRAKIRAAARSDILMHVTLPEAYQFVARAVQTERGFLLNRDFVIREGEIVIVDRLTGRLAEGRQWQLGIQQSLEAAHELNISLNTCPVAKVTIQAFLRGFHHLSGTTGTAQEANREFRNYYGMRCIVIPPYRPCQRIEWPAQITNTLQEKWGVIVSSVQRLKRQGRPVLIGTRDLNASADLSAELNSVGIDHQVLTARQEADEAELISRAGEPGAVTVSTSLAGRGTDIQLGDGVAQAGGLHVIAADLFDAARIDRQLAGRGGRQGDPATYQKILCLEDELLRSAWDPQACQRRIQGLKSRGNSSRLSFFKQTQQIIEHRHVLARRQLLIHDREQTKRNLSLGFDPYLDEVES